MTTTEKETEADQKQLEKELQDLRKRAAVKEIQDRKKTVKELKKEKEQLEQRLVERRLEKKSKRKRETSADSLRVIESSPRTDVSAVTAAGLFVGDLDFDFEMDWRAKKVAPGAT